MNINEVRKTAKMLGVNTRNMKKREIILAIQRAEKNIDCFGSDRVNICGEETCLWREDCYQPQTKK